jgi:hypothetical protein
MKKTWITMLVIVAASVGVFAQGSFGIKGGLNVANQSISGTYDPDEVKPMFGFHGGLFVTMMFSDKIGVQPELLYSTQGSTSRWSSQEYEDKMEYITLPVLLRFNFNEVFSLHAGPQFGYLMSAKEKFEGVTEDMKDDFKTTDLGVALGAEIDLPARVGYSSGGGPTSLRKVNLPSRLGFGARYVLGVYDIVKQEGDWVGYETKNNTIQVYLKYRIAGR